MRHFLGLILLLGILSGCGDSTGGARVSFSAFAAGPASATGGPLTFTNHQGYAVTLTRAKLHIGAMYLNQTVPTSGAQETSCVLPGTYVAQVLSSVDVDALSPLLQPFADQGHGVATQAQVGELWLTGGDISAIDDQTVILDAAGHINIHDANTMTGSGSVQAEGWVLSMGLIHSEGEKRRAS